MKKLLLMLFLFVPLTGMRPEALKTVYICTGPKAKVYHATPKCKGLYRCSKEVIAISLDEINKTRRPCKICY
ncbi:hypothetical protein EZS27_000567 [termite gut metagenome]|uniref:Uncharacterized protein n=1 Tax=termite gut metagenome TaxID=433724 RepID=A0A5J4SZX4_9ZZZZ